MAETEKNKRNALWDWFKDVERHSQYAIAKKAASKWMQPLLIKCVLVVAIIFLGVVSWRIAWADWTVDFSQFEFSDLLALIMGIFAVSMSVAFYFKATDTSNKFYDNVYKFTQDTSVILGRIEAGFGERLRHLDEGYSGLQTRFDNFSILTPEENEKKVEKNKEREEVAKAKLQESSEEKQKILQELAQRAKLQAEEKAELFENLNRLEDKNNKAEKRLRILQKERDKMEEEMHKLKIDESRELGEMEVHLEEIFHRPELRHFILESKGVSFERMSRHFMDFIHRFTSRDIVLLQNNGIISEKGQLTLAGYLAMKNIRRSLRR